MLLNRHDRTLMSTMREQHSARPFHALREDLEHLHHEAAVTLDTQPEPQTQKRQESKPLPSNGYRKMMLNG